MDENNDQPDTSDTSSPSPLRKPQKKRKMTAAATKPEPKPEPKPKPRRRRIFGRSPSEPAEETEALEGDEDELEELDELDELEEEFDDLSLDEPMLDYMVKEKPTLSAEEERLLRIRAEQKGRKPTFRRQEWFRYKRLGTSYRKPKGLHSKMRRGKKYRSKRVKVGYRSPKAVRGRHPSGFEEVLVYRVKDLRTLDPRRQAARIAHGVGTRKRIEIEEEADNRSIRVLNRGF